MRFEDSVSVFCVGGLVHTDSWREGVALHLRLVRHWGASEWGYLGSGL